ncbi:hypothetical protein Ddc_10179 [Ditylenchus destructor]|nr:hypothetical protein Ddc_10179 [Ditylenchus destructor]
MILIFATNVCSKTVNIIVYHVPYSQQDFPEAYKYTGKTISIDDGKTCNELIDEIYYEGWYRSGQHLVVTPNPDPRKRPVKREVSKDEVFNYDPANNAKLSYGSINSSDNFRKMKIKRMHNFTSVLIVHNDQ